MDKNQQQVLNSGLSYNVFEHPFAKMSKEERKVAIDEIQKNSLKNYSMALKGLIAIFEKYNVITILSHLSDYALTGGLGDNKSKSIGQAEVEICQALILHIDFDTLKSKRPTYEVFQEIIDLLKKLLESNILKNNNSTLLEKSEKDIHIEHFRNFVISHTQSVRNWGTFKQVNQISLELYSHFDSKLLESNGFTISQASIFFNYLILEIEKKATDKLLAFRKIKNVSTTEEMIYLYHDFIGSEDDEPKKILKWIQNNNIEDKEYIFMEIIYAHYIDIKLPYHFIFNYKEIAKKLNMKEEIIIAIVNEFSYTLSGLNDKNIEYFFLENPIWTKPMIVVDKEEFFCSNLMTFFSFILKSFDSLIEKIDPIKLSQVKAEYLEDKIEKIVKNRFSQAKIYKSFKWDKFENDLVMVIDTYIIIFEAKSGKITDSALRGSPSRLKKKVKELLVEPNIQSKRLKDKLEYLIDNPSKKDILRDKLELNEYTKILRVSVTFEYFAFSQMGITLLDKTGWIPKDFVPCPTMNIASFETVFDIFDNPIEIINYLEMREELELKIKYQGDELDLISYYIDSHLILDGIDTSMRLILTGQAEKIDNYYSVKDYGHFVEKPKTTIDNFFKNIILQLEERKPFGWMNMSSIFYRLTPLIEEEFFQAIETMHRELIDMGNEGNYLNKMVFTPFDSEYAFCYVVYNYETYNKRFNFIDDAVQNALSVDNIKYCLVVGKNLDVTEHYYSFIAIVTEE